MQGRVVAPMGPWMTPVKATWMAFSRPIGTIGGWILSKFLSNTYPEMLTLIPLSASLGGVDPLNQFPHDKIKPKSDFKTSYRALCADV